MSSIGFDAAFVCRNPRFARRDFRPGRKRLAVLEEPRPPAQSERTRSRPLRACRRRGARLGKVGIHDSKPASAHDRRGDRDRGGRPSPRGSAPGTRNRQTSAGAALGRHPQDPARRRDHAGEPLVRQLLRDVPGRRRHPDEERQCRRCACPIPRRRPVRRAVRRPPRRQRRRAAHGTRTPWPTSTAARWTASSAQASLTPTTCCIDPRQARGLHQIGAPDVMGYHTEQRHPELLDVRARLRAPGPHVRAERVVEPAGAPLHGVGVVGATARQHDDPSSCTNAVEIAGPSRRTPPAPTGLGTDLRVDRPHVPAAQAARVVGLLRHGRHPARLREPDAIDLPAGAADARHARASGIRCRTSTPSKTTASSATSRPVVAASTPQPRSGTLPAVSWVVPSGDGQRAPARPRSAPAWRYVTSLINAVMRSPDWSSTAIFLAWDDWGGFYDNVVPPTVDENGYGLRVPGSSSARTPRRATSTTRP